LKRETDGIRLIALSGKMLKNRFRSPLSKSGQKLDLPPRWSYHTTIMERKSSHAIMCASDRFVFLD
jgi:hypothetical protein